MFKLKRVIGSALMIMTLSVPMTLSMPVSADMISINSLYTDDCSSKLSISGSTASCKSDVIGITGITTKICINQLLEKKNASGSWSYCKSSSNTTNGNKASLSKSYSGLAKGTYRVKTTAVVYAGNKSETITSYSSTKTVT